MLIPTPCYNHPPARWADICQLDQHALLSCLQVLCSVKNQQKALKEAMRVLRPGGKFLFIEHVLAPKDQQGTRFFQNLLTNLHMQQTLADGCHLNRETLAAVEQAGFKDVNAMRFTLDGFSVIGPHVAGIATV